MRWQENLSLAPQKGAQEPRAFTGPPHEIRSLVVLAGNQFPTSFPASPWSLLTSISLLALSLMQMQDTKGDKNEEARVPSSDV